MILSRHHYKHANKSSFPLRYSSNKHFVCLHSLEVFPSFTTTKIFSWHNQSINTTIAYLGFSLLRLISNKESCSRTLQPKIQQHLTQSCQTLTQKHWFLNILNKEQQHLLLQTTNRTIIIISEKSCKMIYYSNNQLFHLTGSRYVPFHSFTV